MTRAASGLASIMAGMSSSAIFSPVAAEMGITPGAPNRTATSVANCSPLSPPLSASTLLTARIIGFFSFLMVSYRSRSRVCRPLVASIRNTMTLAWSNPLSTVSGSCPGFSTPGVSMRVKGPKSVRTSSRVVPGWGETLEIFSPLILLKRVLLPVLGCPTITTVLFSPCSTSSCACFQFTAFIKPCTAPMVPGRFLIVLIPSSRMFLGLLLLRTALFTTSTVIFFLCSSSSSEYLRLFLATLYFLP